KNGKTHVFNTYNTGGQLKGFKKYPVKSETIEHRGESEKMQTHFKPLANGTEFKAKVRFHNLRPLEIGALINALTLLQTKQTYHNIGYAKPLGYGKVKISNLKSSTIKQDLKDYAELFEIEMRARYSSWRQRMEELLTMSSNQEYNVEQSLKYNDLDKYQAIKDKGLYLQPYSEIAQKFDFQNSYKKETENRYKEINKEELEKERKIENLKKTFANLKTEEKYEEALNKLKELNELQSVENFDEEIDNISNLKVEQDEKNFIEYLIREG